MALLSTINETILLAAKREVKFLNSNGTILSKLTLPAFDPKNTKQIEDKNDDDERTEATVELAIKSGSSNEESVIQNIAVSPNGHLLVITSTGDKSVYTYKILATDKHELISKRALPRISSAMVFSSDSRYVYIADKTGDCYEFDCENANLAGKWILGHLSMVLDVLVNDDLRFVITCDRDEKIRVTNYPATYLIETYCLGHTEYVSAISFLPTSRNRVLLSVSGDRMLKLWSYIEGVKIFEQTLPSAGLKMISRKFDEVTCHVAVTLYEGPNLVIYEIVQANDQTFAVKLLSEHSFQGCKEITSIVYENDGNILLAAVNDENRVDVQRLVYASDNYVQQDSDELNKNIGDTVLDLQYNFENISMLFKKRYDNIKDYHERKKRRIEDQKRNS